MRGADHVKAREDFNKWNHYYRKLLVAKILAKTFYCFLHPELVPVDNFLGLNNVSHHAFGDILQRVGIGVSVGEKERILSEEYLVGTDSVLSLKSILRYFSVTYWNRYFHWLIRR